MSDHIIIEQNDGIQSIRLNRLDKKNALTDKMYAAIASALQAANQTDDIRVNLLLGGENCFTAGNDLNDFLHIAQTGEMPEGVQTFLHNLATSEKPIVTAIDGMAIGVGTTLNFHADLVYASTNAFFATPFLDLALVPEAGSSLTIPAAIGYVQAFEILVLGETIPAERALAMGFVNKVVAPGELEATAKDAAARLAAKPPAALKAARELMRPSTDDIVKQIRLELEVLATQIRSDEAKQAFMNFLSKSS